MSRLAITLVIACSLAGCSRKPAPTAVVFAPAIAPPSSSASPPTKSEGAHGSRKLKNADVPVFVDGKQLATLRHSELPSALAPRALSKTAGDARFYPIRGYLAALGVPTARIRAVHVRGNGHRIASIEGQELAREKDRFLFDFMERDAGIAKTRWETTGLRNTFRIDEIRELFVFVDKAVPALDARRSCYLETAPASGSDAAEPSPCSAKVPYAEEEAAKGTRVYLDGRLVGQVKKRRLTDDLVVGTDESGKHRFALVKLLRSFGVDPARAKGIELVSGDDLIARGDFAKPESERALTFVLPAHRHGRVLLRMPSPWLAGIGQETQPSQQTQQTQQTQNIREAEVTAVLVYQTTTPTKRSLDFVPDVPPPEDNVLVDDG